MLAAGRALLMTREPPAPSYDFRLIASDDPVGSLSRCGSRLRSGAVRADDTISRRHLPETVSPAPPTVCGLLDRLPPQIGRDILALQMEDHYVRVHTRKGSALVLMPLRQAVQEVGHRPGLTVHRSWWVARDAVTGWRRDGRNIRLVLVGGLDVPVARARLVAAREAGLVG
ncbi:hypothetical protein DK412_01585 [Methylobacterium sp. 17Sr1-1]|nr:hypothetical protein DK412_01585 [Methylobacterium sp. 17Sr1-1]